MRLKRELHFGKRLVEARIITDEQLDIAIKLQLEQGYDLKRALRELNFIDDEKIAQYLSREYQIPFLSLNAYKIEQGVTKLIPREIAEKYQVMPLFKIKDTITVAIADPLDFWKVSNLEYITKSKIKIVIAPESEITSAIKNFYREDEDRLMKDLELDIFLATNAAKTVEIVEAREEFVDLEEVKTKAEELLLSSWLIL